MVFLVRARYSLNRSTRRGRLIKKPISGRKRLPGRRASILSAPKGAKELWGYKTFLEKYNNFHWLFMPLQEVKTGTENFKTSRFRERISQKGYTFEMLRKEKGRLVSQAIRAMDKYYKPFGLKEKEFTKNVCPLLYRLYVFLRRKGFTNAELFG